MDSAPAVMIIGAGAMGIVTGYHLSLAGADITFFVRYARAPHVQQPQYLYCHNDRSLKTFSGYRVISSLAQMVPNNPDYILITLDGTAIQNDEGSALLAEIGTMIMHVNTILIIGAVGIGIREHVINKTGLPPKRILCSLLGLLSYQVADSNILIEPPAPLELISQAAIAYVQAPNKMGFAIENRYPAQAHTFAKLYDRSLVSKCSVMNATVFEIFTSMSYPLYAVSEIAGWLNLTELKERRDLWKLNCEAQREIMGLKQFGWTGKLMQMAMRNGVQSMMWKKIENGLKPINFASFNKFHHGGKVLAQDIAIMERCVEVGMNDAQPMSALQEVLRQLKALKGTNSQSLF